MSYESQEQIFLYHGYGLGIGGYLERYGSHIPIPSIGSVALSMAGGEAVASSGAWSWAPEDEPDPPKGFRISVRGIRARLWTEETRKEWVTNAEVVVKGFNLCDRVEIGQMVTRLRSVHTKNAGKHQPRISFQGSGLWNVKIEGEPAGVTIDDDLDEFATHDELKDVVGGKRPTRFCPNNLHAPQASQQALQAKPDYFVDLREKYKNDSHTRCSIVGDIRKGREKHPKAKGYSVEIEDFGRIFFGEMLVSDGMKRLNLIRWDLGCDDCGGGTGGSADLNGEPMP